MTEPARGDEPPVPDLTPPEVARWAARVGLSLPDERHAVVAAGVDHFRSVVAVLHELDLADTPPAEVARAESDVDAAL